MTSMTAGDLEVSTASAVTDRSSRNAPSENQFVAKPIAANRSINEWHVIFSASKPYRLGADWTSAEAGSICSGYHRSL